MSPSATTQFQEAFGGTVELIAEVSKECEQCKIIGNPNDKAACELQHCAPTISPGPRGPLEVNPKTQGTTPQPQTQKPDSK
jgi:hypothetical protein